MSIKMNNAVNAINSINTMLRKEIKEYIETSKTEEKTVTMTLEEFNKLIFKNKDLTRLTSVEVLDFVNDA